MNVEQVIAALQKFPPHFEVEAVLVCIEGDDKTAGFVGVIQEPITKIVYLELEGRLMP